MNNKTPTLHARPIIKRIAFFGDASVPETDPTYRAAYEVAQLAAHEGFTIVNGGGPGVMNAATAGAEAVNGETLAVTFNPQDAPGFEGKYLGNVTDQEIVTTNYIERMFKLIEHADTFIIFKGGSGTISEFGTAWVLAKIYYGHHKPFILYGRFWEDIIEAVRRNMNIDAEELSVFEIVSQPQEVLPTLKRFEKRLREINHQRCQVCQGKVCTKNPFQN